MMSKQQTIELQKATRIHLVTTMAQPPNFNENGRFRRDDESDLGRAVDARDRRIGVLQRECERLKKELDRYRVKLDMLRKQVINGDVHQGRNSLRASQFDSYDHSNLEIIGRFCKTKLFPHHKFLHSSWSQYSPSDETSLYFKCREEIDLPSTEDEQFYWINKTVPFINKKYSEIRGNINSNIKGGYLGEWKMY